MRAAIDSGNFAGKLAEGGVQARDWYTPLKVVGYLVLAVMAVSLVYAGYISLANYAGIGV